MTADSTLKQNELYVAFSFAAADMLFELDEAGRITFAVGTAMKLLGCPARLLPGTVFADLVTEAARPELERAFASMRAGGRVRGVTLAAGRAGGGAHAVEISGYRHPDKPGNLLVVMAHATQHPPTVGAERRVPQSGLLDRDGFQAVADQLLQSAPADHPYQMTLLDLPDVEALRTSAGSEAAESFVAELGSRLKALSVGGDAAGQLSDTQYGVIHSAEVDPASIQQAISEAAIATVPEAPPPKPTLSTLVLDVGDVPPEDIGHVLAYALNSFTKAGAEGGLAALNAGLQPKLSATVREMKAVREMIGGGGFDILYQPIVDLWNKAVHHYECLIRFSGDDNRSPYDTVTFAEDTGLAGDIDLAVAERVIQAMRAPPFTHPALRFAVNLSGRTLSDPRVVKRLRPLLVDAAKTHRGRLLFEMTESAEIKDFAAVNAVIQEIRGMGFEMCLDDFGAGAAAFHYLRALTVDHVKIDGSYIKDCVKDIQVAAFVRAIVGLCNDLQVATIAEYVEDIETVNLLRLLKVRYGQGYLFGKPMRPGKAADPKDCQRPWLTPAIEWRNGLLYWKG